MHLLGQFIIGGHIHHQVWKDLNGLFLMQGFLDFFDSGGGVPKDHGQAQDGRLPGGKPEQHILNSDLQPAVDALRQGFIILVGGVFAIGVKYIGRGEKEQPNPFAADEFCKVNMGLYLGCKITAEG